MQILLHGDLVSHISSAARVRATNSNCNSFIRNQNTRIDACGRADDNAVAFGQTKYLFGHPLGAPEMCRTFRG